MTTILNRGVVVLHNIPYFFINIKINLTLKLKRGFNISVNAIWICDEK
jgi:hypothetical protein